MEGFGLSVHLTDIVSKVVERTIGSPLLMFLEAHGYGDNQWAFRKRSSARDLVLTCMSQCILAICSGKKVEAYLSDISGAFDKVFKDFLMARLCSVGVADVFLRFLNAYLEPRVGVVTIENVFSNLMVLSDTVFQGTVLGPPLWNVFFHDVAGAASARGGEEKMFADDLNIFHRFDQDTPNEEIIAHMSMIRNDVHSWGRRNRVEFDHTREYIKIIHPVSGEGTAFKLLGCLLDTTLLMNEAIDQLVARVRPKIKAMLRTRSYYDVKAMLEQFKNTHLGIYRISVWSHGPCQR